MLPRVIPLVRVLWKRTKKIIHGMTPIKAAALCELTVDPYCPCAMAIAMVIV
jgi:hypothetical protein